MHAGGSIRAFVSGRPKLAGRTAPQFTQRIPAKAHRGVEAKHLVDLPEAAVMRENPSGIHCIAAVKYKVGQTARRPMMMASGEPAGLELGNACDWLEGWS